MHLSPEQLDRFREDGCVLVENVFTRAELQPVMDELDSQVGALAEKLFAGGRIQSKHEDKDFYTRLTAIAEEFEGAAPLFLIDGAMGDRMAELWSCDKLLDIVEQVIGPDIEGGPVWVVRSKVPNSALMTVPWHQDNAYWQPGAEETEMLTAWIPFIDATRENGCLQVVPGAHKARRCLPHHIERKVGDPRSWYLYINEEDLPSSEFVTYEVPLGSILLLTQFTAHRSLQNYSHQVRWSVDLRFQPPGEPTGMEGNLLRGPLMRRSDDPQFRPDTAGWRRKEQEAYKSFSGRADVDPFDSTIDGKWLERWDDRRAAEVDTPVQG
jgi:hypothetical protein